ncbi:unnamed protein product [Rotaria socialis]|uniref:Uncharacterized protein n=3 Tax=Rotaria socialis TaxID=392032 RepID=A0A817TCP0_9BILA|nr:unnamed protein product [Rotaria socialis]CAF4836577.1 unnamed protein product [Rotaria socialis]
MGKHDLAEKYFMRFLEQLSLDDPLLGDLYHDLGRLASSAGNSDKSMEWRQKAIALKKQKQPTSKSTIPKQSSSTVNIPANAKWAQNGVTIAGGNGAVDATNQLSYPQGLFVDDDQTVVIADYWNHRITQWKNGDTMNGQVVAGGKGQGNGLHQLDRPTDVLIDKETDSLIICDWGNRRVVRWSVVVVQHKRYIYISDYVKHEVRRYQLSEKNGTLVAGGNGKGNGLSQLNDPRYLFVDRQQNVYVSDNSNHHVMKWNKGAKEGIVVAGGQGRGNALT